ncbi:type II toxin-antitoxin system RelE/ParE family toxin [Chryseobacterium sp. PS-8]|uniref:Type II toxin-antitoxin system RelE/ParE family toxin n=1 Tax=Chryseobacterium indicum TaxID=2766954 RepID=A0ABS9C8B1_9FLAO|nr:type II toxin-antitoxin system RelE/ParE family toxin [Chryseobacterium sp. PS-8]MCF2219942.1 type II toxin-antitoxin system RelE/ParE family toxin [Chryseobacterium sp. PS-8]
MAKQIIWTKRASNEWLDILQYWINRNKSNSFSIKLNNLIKNNLELLSEFPDIGRKTDIPNVSVKIVHKYLLYYECVDHKIYILTIRHGSKNPDTVQSK